MNRTLTVLSALGAGLLTAVAATAQTAPPAAPAHAPASQAAPPSPPQAVPAKVALISFEQAVFATNEGQRAVEDIQKKYAPKKSAIETQAAEVDSLKKQVQNAPSTMTDEQRAAKLRDIDAKEKALNRDAEDASQAYNADLQDAYGRLAQKVNVVMRKYVEDNGYTLLLDVSGQQSPVMWATSKVNTDVTQAVVNAYNASSGIAAPTPSAPAPSAAPRTRPAPARP